MAQGVAGPSLYYVKCFDIIPQAVVLRVVRELGMDRGALRALAAMYRQLRRAWTSGGGPPTASCTDAPSAWSSSIS